MPRKLHMARLFLLVIAFGRGVISYSSCLPLGHDHNAATSSSPPRENGSKFFDLEAATDRNASRPQQVLLSASILGSEHEQ
jgi:hypothetical protein